MNTKNITNCLFSTMLSLDQHQSIIHEPYEYTVLVEQGLTAIRSWIYDIVYALSYGCDYIPTFINDIIKFEDNIVYGSYYKPCTYAAVFPIVHVNFNKNYNHEYSIKFNGNKKIIIENGNDYVDLERKDEYIILSQSSEFITIHKDRIKEFVVDICKLI